MKLYSPKGLFDLARYFVGTSAVQEHSAWAAHLNLATDTTALKSLGFDVVYTVEDVAVFLQHCEHPERRIELVQSHVTEHEAWIVKTQDEFTLLDQRFTGDPDFTFAPREFHLEHLWAKMFRHKDGGVVQIVWRRDQIYKNLWPEE